ncbi:MULTISPECIES: TetR/AcrR family transcriptional regulator [Vibrio]|uniref:TetR/AcrR family transcriptional regulator n=1 Tax=Vibrio cortegadensis TaxID=1328770 RepID=A0ABV4M2P4_9VIBR|nr:TetR/AcrR family transcriptional regulator [Vibrio genomosp. F6]RBW64543.1 TetR/AcrR family transcriptional regulator [Vibrionales bacterium C3R12]TKF21765.1 TetR/AcrR family transcriptional regulator [Vibrio genomosp. F6]
MSRKAQFDRDDVITKAKDLYWAKGYHGTSMRTLQEALDMRSGSIYAAFGSKDNLFIEAIQRYAQDDGKTLAESMANSDSQIDGLKTFIRKIILSNRDSAPSGMCMLVKSVSELTEADNPELFAVVTELLGRIQTTLVESMKTAIHNGEIHSDKDPVELACYIQVQIIGLRTFARATNEFDVVERFIDDIFVSGPFK